MTLEEELAGQRGRSVEEERAFLVGKPARLGVRRVAVTVGSTCRSTKREEWLSVNVSSFIHPSVKEY